MSNKFLGERIKAIRKSKKITQSELAELVGYSDRSMITKIEQGVVDLPESKIISIASSLGVTPHYLVGWETSKFEKRELIEKIQEKARSQNINIAKIKEIYNLESFDDNIDLEILYKISSDFKVNINNGIFLNKIIRRESEIKKWFYNEIDMLSDKELEELKNILEPMIKIIKK